MEIFITIVLIINIIIIFLQEIKILNLEDDIKIWHDNYERCYNEYEKLAKEVVK